jgi:3-oxoacyl-[acyl-carrier protein] reductase
MIMDDLNGRVALVTGASRGIGRDIALALAAAGCSIAVAYNKDKVGAEAVVGEIKERGQQAVALTGDVAKPDAAAALVRDTESQLGPIGILVNNAGINPVKPLDQITAEDWDEIIRVNLSSAFYVTQAALPGLRTRKWGRIIIMSSIAAQTGGVIGPHYAASKAGLIGLAHSYAAMLVKEGITSNVIAPALIETDMIKGNPRDQADPHSDRPLRHGGRGLLDRCHAGRQWLHHRPDNQRQRRLVYELMRNRPRESPRPATQHRPRAQQRAPHAPSPTRRDPSSLATPGYLRCPDAQATACGPVSQLLSRGI